MGEERIFFKVGMSGGRVVRYLPATDALESSGVHEGWAPEDYEVLRSRQRRDGIWANPGKTSWVLDGDWTPLDPLAAGYDTLLARGREWAAEEAAQEAAKAAAEAAKAAAAEAVWPGGAPQLPDEDGELRFASLTPEQREWLENHGLYVQAVENGWLAYPMGD